MILLSLRIFELQFSNCFIIVDVSMVISLCFFTGVAQRYITLPVLIVRSPISSQRASGVVVCSKWLALFSFSYQLLIFCINCHG